MSAVNQDSRGYIKFLENQIQRVLGQISDLSQKVKLFIILFWNNKYLI